jgi:predicted enzyme related to lactoylglutathione lyase
MTTATALTRLAASPVSAVLPAEDVERARHFYSEALGLEVSPLPDPDAFFVHAGGGTRLLVYKRARTVAEHTVAGFEVDDLGAVMTELRGRGVMFEEYDLPGLRTVDGVAEMPDSRTAWFTDSEGNIIAIMETR